MIARPTFHRFCVVLGVSIVRAAMVPAALLMVAPAPGFAQQGAARGSTPREYRGTVEPIRKYVFSARYDGLVGAIHFIPGQIMKEGDLVIEFRLTAKQLDLERARAHRRRAEAELRGAETTLDRFRRLGQGNAIAIGQILDAEVARDVAASKLNEAQTDEKQAELIVGDMELHAPFSGIMSSPFLPVGTYIDLDSRTSRPLAEIVQLDPIWVVYKVPFDVYYERRKAMGSEKDLLQHLVLSLVLPNGDVYPDTGRIKFVDYRVDQATQTICVWAEFANPEYLLRPGLEVKIQSRLDDRQHSRNTDPR